MAFRSISDISPDNRPEKEINELFIIFNAIFRRN